MTHRGVTLELRQARADKTKAERKRVTELEKQIADCEAKQAELALELEKNGYRDYIAEEAA